MISLDAARRAMADVAVERDDYARTVETLSNFRSRQSNDASMPAVAGNHRGMRLNFAIRSILKFFHSAIKDLALGFHALAVTRVEMFRQPPRFFFLGRLEEFDDCARCVHPSGSVDARPDTKAE